MKRRVEDELVFRLSRATDAGLKYQEEYELVLSSLAAIRLQKCLEYGESRYEEVDPLFNRWMLFSDVHRKYIRLRQQLNRADLPGLIETYQDMANYAIMAVQMLKRETDANV